MNCVYSIGTLQGFGSETDRTRFINYMKNFGQTWYGTNAGSRPVTIVVSGTPWLFACRDK